MIVSTTDPITLHEVKNPETHPFIIEGEGENTLKIYFENDENKHIYMDIAVKHPGDDFTNNLDHPAPMTGELDS